MTTEIYYLTLVTFFTTILWVPYILNTIMVRGLMDAVGYPENPKPLSPWAARLKKAHYNAVENLVIFAPLVLAIQLLSLGNSMTAVAVSVYFWARVVHALAYTFAIPWVRTLAFAAGFVCQVLLAYRLFHHLPV